MRVRLKAQCFFFAMSHFDWPFTKRNNRDAFNISQLEAFSTNMGL
jgi:hypothetical protein